MARTRQPTSAYWIVAGLLTLWGLAGCYACLQQLRLGADAMGPATAADRALYEALPAWYNIVYAIAVGAGLLGALALIARRAEARLLFALSLAAVVVQFGWLFATTDIVARKGAMTVLPFPIVIALIAAGAIWYAGEARRRGWLR